MDATVRHTHNLLPSPAADDRRLQDDIAHALRATGRFAASRVDIDTSGGIVRLRGRVRSYYHKQLAQVAASALLGDRELVNEIHVESS